MFFLISGVGHCGTSWLSSILDRPDEGMKCFHEYKYESVSWLRGVPFAWEASLKKEIPLGLDAGFDEYFEAVQGYLDNFNSVGDSHSWEPFLIPDVDQRLRLGRVIHLVRDGIPNVHSLYYHNAGISRRDWIYEEYFRTYWERMGSPFGDYGELSDWACWCLLWQSNLWAIGFLAERLGPERFEVRRFEDLLSDGGELSTLVRGLNSASNPSRREVQLHQATDISRKIEGDRSPTYLWQRWTDEQRDIFKRICGEGMDYFGYSIPARP